MQVQAINSQNNQTLTPTLSQRARGKDVSFGAIFYPKNIKFNKVQEPIAETIKNALREPLQIFKGETAEGFYKSKGYDFGIEPYWTDSVHLTAYKGMEETGTGVDRRYTYSDKLYIGEYDKKSEFRVSDIEKGIKDKNRKDLGFAGLFLIMSLAISAIAFNKPISKFAEKLKPSAELVDSTAIKAKSVLPDTTAVNTKILKTIKRSK